MAISIVRAQDSDQSQPPRVIGACAANGCTGAGAIEAGSQLLCCWHHAAAPHFWPEITRRVRKYRNVEHIVRTALSVGFYEWEHMAVEAAEFFIERNQPDLAPQREVVNRAGVVVDETRSAGAYAYRLNAWLREQILTSDVIAPPAPKGATKPIGPRRLFDCIPERVAA